MARTPLATAVYEVVISGMIETTQSWSTSFWMALIGGSAMTQADLDSDATGIAALVHTWAVSLEAYERPTVTFNEVKVTFYEAGAITPTLVSVPVFSTVTGNASVAGLPTQCAVVHTLKTNRPGKSGHGRMYVPLTCIAQMDGDGQVQGSNVSSLSTSLAGLFTALNASAPANGGSFAVSVVSWTHALITAVSRVVVDSVVDTQRRRRNKIGATAVTSTTV